MLSASFFCKPKTVLKSEVIKCLRVHLKLKQCYMSMMCPFFKKFMRGQSKERGGPIRGTGEESPCGGGVFEASHTRYQDFNKGRGGSGKPLRKGVAVWANGQQKQRRNGGMDDCSVTAVSRDVGEQPEKYLEK